MLWYIIVVIIMVIVGLFSCGPREESLIPARHASAPPGMPPAATSSNLTPPEAPRRRKRKKVSFDTTRHERVYDKNTGDILVEDRVAKT